MQKSISLVQKLKNLQKLFVYAKEITIMLTIACTAITSMPAPSSHHVIQSISIEKNTVKIMPTQKLVGQYIRNPIFFAEYTDDIDLTELDYAIVTLPFILSIIPIIWLSGETFYIERMDADIASSLEKIHLVFKTFYPSIPWKGRLVANQIVENHPKSPNPATALLFSGGVDAMCSSIRYRSNAQLLITIWGTDVMLYNDQAWKMIQGACKKFSTKYGQQFTWVKTNGMTFLNHTYLSSISPEIPNWWAYTTQALAYCGLVAPIVTAKGCSALLIASSHTKDYPYPYGTHPQIDNNIAFAGAQVIHDSYDLHRQDKIRFLIDFMNTNPEKRHPLRVCPGNTSDKLNCSHCEKCLRTINALIVEGENPRAYGFDTFIPQALALTKVRFTTTNDPFRLTYGLVGEWQEILDRFHEQKNLKELPTHFTKELLEHFNWLCTVDLNAFNRHKHLTFQKIQ